MSRTDEDSQFRIPYPLEFVIGQTLLAAQAKNSKAKDNWKKTVGQCAREAINALREQHFLDERPLMATIYYFPLSPMLGAVLISPGCCPIYRLAVPSCWQECPSSILAAQSAAPSQAAGEWRA